MLPILIDPKQINSVPWKVYIIFHLIVGRKMAIPIIPKSKQTAGQPLGNDDM